MQAESQGRPVRREKSVILIWLDGGPSQLETYDPKPEAPVEFRGPWGAIKTNVPGTFITEMFPLQAQNLQHWCDIPGIDSRMDKSITGHL